MPTVGASRRPSGYIASVDKAVRLLERLSRPGATGTTLTELAADLDLPISSLHHTLATLRSRGWVEQDDTGRYLLGPASILITRWWESTEQLTRLVRPALEAISARTAETVHLGRLSGTNVIYLDKVEPDRPVRVISQVGRAVPAATTAMGRALLAARAQGGAEVWARSVPDAAPNLLQRLTEETDRLRTHGYAVEIEENEAGIACVAVPVLLDGRPRAAVSVTLPVERSDPERLGDLAAQVADALDALTDTHVRAYRPA